MTRFIDAHKTVQVALLDLAVHNAVRGGDVDKSSIGESWCIDLLCNGLAAKPIAVEVTIDSSAFSDQDFSKAYVSGSLTHLRST